MPAQVDAWTEALRKNGYDAVEVYDNGNLSEVGIVDFATGIRAAKDDVARPAVGKDAEIEATGLDKLLVVDNLVYYRGTVPNGRRREAIYAEGTHLSQDRDTADFYARDDNQNMIGEVRAYRANLRKSFIWEEHKPAEVKAKMDAILPGAFRDSDSVRDVPAWTAALKRAGYDSVKIVNRRGEVEELIVFDDAALVLVDEATIPKRRQITRDEIISHLEGNRVGLKEANRFGADAEWRAKTEHDAIGRAGIRMLEMLPDNLRLGETASALYRRIDDRPMVETPPRYVTGRDGTGPNQMVLPLPRPLQPNV